MNPEVESQFVDVTTSEITPQESLEVEMEDQDSAKEVPIPVQSLEQNESLDFGPPTLESSTKGLYTELIQIEEGCEAELHTTIENLDGGTQRAFEGARQLGLSDEEIQEVSTSIRFSDNEKSLVELMKGSYERLGGSIKSASGVAATAFFVSMSNSAYAEKVALPEQNAIVDKVALEQVERAPLPSYEEGMRRLRQGILTAPSEEIMVSVQSPGEEMKTIIFKHGKKVSGELSNEEAVLFEKALENKNLKIEFTHTHPLEALNQFSGVTSHYYKKEDVINGDEPPPSMEPSSIDWETVLSPDSPQVKYKVIDPAGVWEYGVENKDSTFIQEMNKINKKQQQGDGFNLVEVLTEDESKYFKEQLEKSETLTHTLFALQNNQNPLAQEIVKKCAEAQSRVYETIPKEDLSAYLDLVDASIQSDPLSRKDYIERKKKEAKQLGLYIEYTPNIIEPLIPKSKEEIEKFSQEFRAKSKREDTSILPDEIKQLDIDRDLNDYKEYMSTINRKDRNRIARNNGKSVEEIDSEIAEILKEGTDISVPKTE